jgi:TRAP-type C4-dicarboxylate transport system substrate-binding protein
MDLRRITIAAIAALCAAAATAACGSSATTDKSGGRETPVTLRLATQDRAQFASARVLTHFAAEVRRRSKGSLRVAITYQAAGTNRSKFDQAAADMVRRGRYDLGFIPARAWDVEGVRTMRALQAPFLLQSTEQVARVLADEELTGAMLAGLRPLGLTGLALLAGHPRHPFGLAGPLRAPRDFAGAAIRAPRSDMTWALLRALGARPVDLDGDRLTAAIARGDVKGAEADLAVAPVTLFEHPTATSNVTFFTRVDTLVANSRALAGLDAADRAVLRAAVADAAAFASRVAATERDAARAYCRVGGRVITASDTDVRALEAAAAPVVAELERDPATRAAVQRIRSVGGAPPPEPAPTCEPAAGTGRRSVPSGDATRTPVDGVYRNTITVRELTAHGVDAPTARQNAGVHTITLRGGRLHDTMRPLEPTGAPTNDLTPCEGRYAVRGATYTFAWDPATNCTGDFTARWSLHDGVLRLTAVRTAEQLDRMIWGLKPFRRIG